MSTLIYKQLAMKYKTLVHPDPVLLKIPPRLILFKSRLAAFLKLSATADFFFILKGKKEGGKNTKPSWCTASQSVKGFKKQGEPGKMFQSLEEKNSPRRLARPNTLARFPSVKGKNARSGPEKELKKPVEMGGEGFGGGTKTDLEERGKEGGKIEEGRRKKEEEEKVERGRKKDRRKKEGRKLEGRKKDRRKKEGRKLGRRKKKEGGRKDRRKKGREDRKRTRQKKGRKEKEGGREEKSLELHLIRLPQHNTTTQSPDPTATPRSVPILSKSTIPKSYPDVDLRKKPHYIPKDFNGSLDQIRAKLLITTYKVSVGVISLAKISPPSFDSKILRFQKLLCNRQEEFC
ncbi:hypothetical protein E2320_012260 [Naja naja]|nr:hypothetical protein E2320_012260 [Naja naja]